MHNEKTDNNKVSNEDYRFLDYKLDQLQHQINTGLNKLEKENKEDNKEIMKMLQLMQDGQNQQNKQLIVLSERQKTVEQKVQYIDKLRQIVTQHGKEIKNHTQRLDIYKQILLAVGTGVGIALIIEIVKFI